ncbi:hypothetical protein BDQ17DRAFT_1171684, partial [Cyathus striatus]
AANSHCTIMGRLNSQLRIKLDNNTKKNSSWSTMKVKARFLTHPQLKAAHAKEFEEHNERKKVAVEKQKQKESEIEETETRIRHDAATKTFELPLSSYKRKDDLRTIARALGLA